MNAERDFPHASSHGLDLKTSLEKRKGANTRRCRDNVGNIRARARLNHPTVLGCRAKHSLRRARAPAQPARNTNARLQAGKSHLLPIATVVPLTSCKAIVDHLSPHHHGVALIEQSELQTSLFLPSNMVSTCACARYCLVAVCSARAVIHQSH